MRRLPFLAERPNPWFAVLLLVSLFLGLGATCRADHPDRAHRPIGKPEMMLSGVYIDSSGHGSIPDEAGIRIEPMSEIFKTLGKPSRIIKLNACESTYVWIRGEVRLEVGSGCVYQKVRGKDVMRTYGAYSIEVWGKHPEGTIGITGRGLALGDSIEKMKRLYGTRCECGRYLSGTGTHNTHGEHYAYYALYQWTDGVELDVDADAKGRVVHMLLDGAVE